MMRHVTTVLICLWFGSCAPDLPSAPDLFSGFEFFDDPLTPLIDSTRSLMEGVYEVEEGQEHLGATVVGRWIGKRWCLYSEHDVVYTETAGGFSADSTVKLFGYVRTVRSGSGNRVRLSISLAEGARHLARLSVPPLIRMRGTIDGRKKMELRRVRAIEPGPPFHILAHRGGGRNSDRLGFSENSIPMIEHAATLGATGIEIDVKRTRDNKIIVFHDDTFSPRTVQGAYLLGKVEQFDLAQIKALGRLIHGEEIPTLAEALDAVIERTPLTLVWLDVKDGASVDAVIRIQHAKEEKAAGMGRQLEILLGIPSEEVLRAFISSPHRDSSKVLVELDVETALSLTQCRAWAPIWTIQLPQTDVDRVQNSGRLVLTWTVDLRESILDNVDRLNGLLSNYPSLVAAIYNSRQHLTH